MRELQLRSLVMALATGFLLVTGAGCSGDENPCDDVECSDGEVCNPDTGVCEDLCDGVTCDDGKVCNPDNGQCVTPDLCAEVSCNETETCNPANGQCESKCAKSNCSATEECVPTTGECVSKCESDTKPRGKAECGAGHLCEATTGNCISACLGKTCPYAQWCDSSDGQCKPKSGPGSAEPPAGYPGTACTTTNDCDDGNNLDPLCLQEFPLTSGTVPAPGGYCTSLCNPEGNGEDCPAGTTCIGACVSVCASDADCRDGYRCSPLGGGEYACLPASTCDKANPDECSPLGGDCEASSDCLDGGFCLTETNTTRSGEVVYSGFLGGYCSWVKRNTDSCPAGSTGLRADPEDPTIEICVKDCQFRQVGACSADEACQPVAINQQTGEITKAVCLDAQCAVDEDCQVAQCSATSKGACGKGQDCVDGDGKPVTGTTVGTCSTQDRCGGSFGTCQFGECSDEGLCVESFCEPTIGLCLFDCRAAPEGENVCGEGATCNADGACVRGCVDDPGCGPNAVCGGDGECIPRCHRWNEDRVCGDSQVCNYDTGHCQAPCTIGSCDSGEVCAEESGRCQRACNAALDPKVCGTNEYCDDVGFCQTKCTQTTENTVCDPSNTDPSQRTYCQVSTGKCLPSCATDPSICGEEACSVAPAPSTVARCGQPCTTTKNCGTSSYNEFLACQGPTNARTCAPVACDDENPCPGEGTSCNAGVCELSCTDDAQCGPGRVCNQLTSLCEDEPPPTCDVDPTVCDAETEFCNAEKACELRCDQGGAACGDDEFCSATTGQCELRCDEGGVVCKDDEFCSETTGQCELRCDEGGAACEDDEFCSETTGQCELRCDAEGATACEGENVCDPDSGLCIASCSAAENPTECDAGSEFVCGDLGLCIKACNAVEDATECEENYDCDEVSGLCVETPE